MITTTIIFLLPYFIFLTAVFFINRSWKKGFDDYAKYCRDLYEKEYLGLYDQGFADGYNSKQDIQFCGESKYLEEVDVGVKKNDV